LKSTAKIATLRDGQRQVGQLAEVPTQEQAAEMLNVGERSVRRAREVLNKGVPELAEKVERGEIKVSVAAKVAELPKERQHEIITKPEGAARRATVPIDAKERIVALCSTIREGLAESADQDGPVLRAYRSAAFGKANASLGPGDITLLRKFREKLVRCGMRDLTAIDRLIEQVGQSIGATRSELPN
jgi:hypothetical protein